MVKVGRAKVEEKKEDERGRQGKGKVKGEERKEDERGR